MSSLREKLAAITEGKTLSDTTDPSFLVSEWQNLSTGARLAVVYTHTDKTGPIATPVVWFPDYVITPEQAIVTAIRRIKENPSYVNSDAKESSQETR